MSISHCHDDSRMTKNLLEGQYVSSVHHEMACKCVPKNV